MRRNPSKAYLYMTQRVNVELTVGELTRLQICLFERIEMLRRQMQEPEMSEKRHQELMMDAVNTAADLKLLTEKALAV